MSDQTVTFERLADYLDAGRRPYDASIEDDPVNAGQLAALQRLRSLSAQLADDEAAAVPPPDPSWLGAVMAQVRNEARSGRDIPIDSPVGRANLHMTEGAVRGLVREAGDSVSGAIVLSCSLIGDVSTVGGHVRVEVEISALRGEFVPVMADEVRAAVTQRLGTQTELTIEAVDIVIGDVHLFEFEGGAA